MSASEWTDTQAGQFLAYSPTTPVQQGGFSGSPLEADLGALAPVASNDRVADRDPDAALRRDDRLAGMPATYGVTLTARF